MNHYTQVKAELDKMDEETQAKDSALHAFLRSLQFRVQLGYRWQGRPDFVACLMLAGSVMPAPGTPAPSIAPGTPCAIPADLKENSSPTAKSATSEQTAETTDVAGATPQKAQQPWHSRVWQGEGAAV